MRDSIVIDSAEMARRLEALALEMLAAHPDPECLMLAGIQRRGIDLALRLERLLGAKNLPVASLDINLYRDDWTMLADGAPHVGISHMPSSPDGKIVLLVDDVLFTGRTIRSALDTIFDYGRPAAIELLVLVDRGHRELPIQADYVGLTLPTQKNEYVEVLLEERDGRDEVLLRRRG